MQTLCKLGMLAFFMSLVMVSSGASSYTATEQYVKNMVAAESNRTDKAINALRTEVKDAQFLKPSSVIAGENVIVSTNAEGQVIISSVGGGGVPAIEAGTNIWFGSGAGGAVVINAKVPDVKIDDEVIEGSGNAVSGDAVYSSQTNFVTKSDITSLSITVDGQSLQFATNAFSEGSIYSIVAGTNKDIIIDLEVHEGSPNAVSGGAVYNALTNMEFQTINYINEAIRIANIVTPEMATNIVNSKMQLLRGQEFDFSKIDGLYNSVRAIIVALEGTVINYPSEVNTYVKNANTNLYYKIQANTNAVGTLTLELDSSPID